MLREATLQLNEMLFRSFTNTGGAESRRMAGPAFPKTGVCMSKILNKVCNINALSVAVVMAFGAVGAGFASAQTPAGSQITLAWGNPPRSIDPRYGTDADSIYLENLIHCSLVDFDKDGKTIGDLAAKWNWVDPTTLEVTLKEGAKFSNGTPVTAADVKATYDYFLRTDLGDRKAPRAGAFTMIGSVEKAAPASGAPAPKTGEKLIFKLKQADATFITNLVVGILPSALANGEMVDDYKKLVGCGPFKLTGREVNDLTLERNPSYGLGPLAKTDRVVIKIVRDEETRLAKLEKGEVDLVQNLINRDKLKNLAKTAPALDVSKRMGLNTTYLGFNMRNNYLKNAKVRKAIGLAVNRDAIIRFALNGLATPASTLLLPQDPFFNNTLPKSSFDTAKAAALLDEAGFKVPAKGQPRFKLNYKTTNDATRVTVAKAIAGQLKKVGIEVTVEPLEWGRFKADVEANHVEMWSLSWIGFKDPDIYRFAFATESFPPAGGNRGWYSNPELDKLLAAGRLETDFAKRKKIYADVQMMVADEMPYVFLWHEEIFAVHNRKLAGFELFADGRYASLKKAVRK